MNILKKLVLVFNLTLLCLVTGVNNQKTSADAGLTLGIIGTALGGAALAGHLGHWFTNLGGCHTDCCGGGNSGQVMYPIPPAPAMAPPPMQMAMPMPMQMPMMAASPCMMPSCAPAYPSVVPGPMMMPQPMMQQMQAPNAAPVVVNVYGGSGGYQPAPMMMPPIIPPSAPQYQSMNNVPVRGLW